MKYQISKVVTTSQNGAAGGLLYLTAVIKIKNVNCIVIIIYIL